jgi:hypothetical protein
MEEDVKLLKRRARPDQFSVRQLAWTAAILLIFFALAANARWKDVTWRRTMATVVSAEEMCAHHPSSTSLRRFFQKGQVERYRVVPCSDVEQNLRIKAAYNHPRPRSRYISFRGKHYRPYRMTTFFEANIEYEKDNGSVVQSSIQIDYYQVNRQRPHPSEISEDRQKLGLWTAVVQPGDRYEIAHSRFWSSRADLKQDIERGRVVWLVAFLLVIVLIGFIFAFDLLPETREEIDQRKQDYSNWGWRRYNS